MWGAYQQAIAAREATRPTAAARHSSRTARRTAAVATNAMPNCGRVQVPTTPAAHAAPTVHGRAVGERREYDDDEYAHREKRESVTACLSRDVEEDRRDGREEEEQDP